MSKRDRILFELGLTIRERRNARALTQEQLAKKAGLDATSISRIGRGQRNPGFNNVAKPAKSLGLTTAELCHGVDA